MDTRPIMVSISCITYNQKKYIRQCLDGFVIQKTNFRFEAIVHDDASTDGTVDVIREYAEKYPDIIKPIFEAENQYSKHDGSLERIMLKACVGKYKAICEGDDYWIDPLKLQKQFDYMESHPSCSLCFHANYVLFPDNHREVHKPINMKGVYSLEDVVKDPGGTSKAMRFMMTTNSMFYRNKYLIEEGYPNFWSQCPVGDIPTRLFFASKGNFGYIDEILSVYRKSVPNSMTTRKKSLSEKLQHNLAMKKMWERFDEYTHFQYHSIIKHKIAENKRKKWLIIIKGTIRSFFYYFGVH